MNLKIISSFIISVGILFSPGCRSAVSTAMTAQKAKPACIIIYGDTQENNHIHRQLVDSMIMLNPAAVFHTGDMVMHGENENHWKAFNTITAPLLKKTKFYPALGNHDFNSLLYFDNFELPNNEQWYSVDIGNIHFIVLDTNWHIFKHSQQYEWLVNDLKTIKPHITFRIVVQHHPPFSSGHHRLDEKHLGDSIVPLSEKYGVDMVFSGHDHIYERLYHNNIFYIVTGGGGAVLYDKTREIPQSQVFFKKHHFCVLYPEDSRLVVKVFDKDMKLIDSFRKSKK
ncbi:MAG: hypothetical protein GTO45_11765 [Candidatus Aminicenantes bacterium]|nr:hypothetical protein [Candidatus Aminicenantes bacterium]NIM79482.1 hypothetical protein [Candidatus Aminicenantes bacterium]NIN18768.1 hypothetical protein [Candidatus Aminicenantes bacterium]NIN42690.1 hypothetical protein [Candidatus Aminicenantes bacterium]NIN85424.1 hypothetical protein [Candidatus Aminicenantes bacterium]